MAAGNRSGAVSAGVLRLRVFAGAFLAGSLHAGANLLQNGSFEGSTDPWLGGFGIKAEAVRVSGPDAASGSGCLRFSCSGQMAAVDHPELRLGRELSRRGTYRLSAMIRNDGVRAGDFGLRLYFHDAAGGSVAMLGGIGVRAGTPPHGWRRYETTFGRGTPTPLPPGSAALTVRFSFWAEDSKPAGTVWLDDVALEAVAEAPGLAPDAVPTALLWDDPALTPVCGAAPAGLASVLAAAGYAVRHVATPDLVAPAALDVITAGALVLPYGEFYPGPLAPVLGTFLAEGGLLVTWGPGALSRPLYPSPHGWLPAGAPAPGGETASLSFAAGWDLAEAGPEDHLDLDPAAKGRTGEFHASRVKGFAYRGTALPAIPAEDVVLGFEARGDRATAHLCLELRERDGSRWKAVVPLTTTWVTWRLHAGQFLSYANQERGRQETCVRPRQLDRLLVGMTAAMAGPGPHAFDLRDLRLDAAAVSTATVAETPAFAGAERDTARWFGAAVRVPVRRPAMTSMPPPAPRWQCGRLRTLDGLPPLARTPLTGHFAGGAVAAPDAVAAAPLSPRADLGSRLRARQACERLPILCTDGAFAAPEHEAAVLMLFREGVLAGGRWLCIGLESPAPADHAGLADLLADALRVAREAVLGDGLAPRFKAVRDGLCMDVVLTARDPSVMELQLPLRVVVTIGDQVCHEARVAARLAGEPGVATECVIAEGIPITGSAWQDLELRAEPVAAPVPVVGRLRFRLAARAALEQVAERLLREADDDAKVDGFSFVDNRGMRVLLAAAQILDRSDLRRAAQRWGTTMVREQRPDGGYRMGYGITAKGEECYVADGGEVAVAIARLAESCSGRQRDALRRSLDAYMEYRDGFRVPGGGIGVGWCLQDYGRRPVVPLDRPTRILAPELNPYTIGCSLAAAYLHAALSDSTPLGDRAAADAEWLMPRTPRLHGAFIESFQYAHALARDRTQRAVYADTIARAFSGPMKEAAVGGRSWWLAGEGRSALDLGGLAYVLARLGDDPELRAEMLRATCRMFSPDSPESVLSALDLPVPGHDGWIYVCYGTLGLVDIIQPLVSMDGAPARP